MLPIGIERDRMSKSVPGGINETRMQRRSFSAVVFMGADRNGID
jgi:hypothetical protein